MFSGLRDGCNTSHAILMNKSCIPFHLSSKWGVLCTEHHGSSSPGSILSASASWVGWITSDWCDLKTQWSIWNPFPHSPHSFLKNLEEQVAQVSIILLNLLHEIKVLMFCQGWILILQGGLKILNLSEIIRADWPKSAFFPFSSGKKRRSTAHTRMCSGMLGDFAPTSSKPAGTSMGSAAMVTRRRSFPAWQNPKGQLWLSDDEA